MKWLLKITEGPMQGAEIALVEGCRVKFGRDESCDVVVADQTLPAVAFELDVADDAVTLVDPDGTAKVLVPFEIHDCGTTAIAVGPADGEWQELKRPAPPPAESAETAPAETEAKPATAGTAEGTGEGEAKPAEGAAAESAPAKKGKFTWIIAGIGLLLLACLGLAAVWYFKVYTKKPIAVATTPAPTVAEIVKAYGLNCAETNGVPFITGNVSRRTERLAIRAAVLAMNPSARFDLTDDETLASSVEALLFTLTEGAVNVTAASNRNVKLAGVLPSVDALKRILQALSADVPGFDGADVSGVRVERVVAHGKKPVASATKVAGGGPAGRATAPMAVAGETKSESAVPAKPGTKVAAKKGEAAKVETEEEPKQRELPVAGILTKPYRCVVLRSGMRCTEGAYFGTARLVAIEADALILEENGTTFTWKP